MSKSAPVIIKLEMPETLRGFLPFSLNLKVALSLTFFLMGLVDMAAHCSSIAPSWIVSGLPKRPTTKFLPKKAIPLPEFLNSSANYGRYEMYNVGLSCSDRQKKVLFVPSRRADFT